MVFTEQPPQHFVHKRSSAGIHINHNSLANILMSEEKFSL